MRHIPPRRRHRRDVQRWTGNRSEPTVSTAVQNRHRQSADDGTDETCTAGQGTIQTVSQTCPPLSKTEIHRESAHYCPKRIQSQPTMSTAVLNRQTVCQRCPQLSKTDTGSPPCPPLSETDSGKSVHRVHRCSKKTHNVNRWCQSLFKANRQ